MMMLQQLANQISPDQLGQLISQVQTPNRQQVVQDPKSVGLQGLLQYIQAGQQPQNFRLGGR